LNISNPSIVVANAEVEEAALLSSPAERTVVKEGAIVQRSILQWGVTVRACPPIHQCHP
jgi:hypothetical protein